MALARNEEHREIHQPGEEIDDAEASDGPADKIVGQNRPKTRPGRTEVVTIPETRPRQHDEEQADFEKERDVGESANQNTTLAPGLWSAA